MRAALEHGARAAAPAVARRRGAAARCQSLQPASLSSLGRHGGQAGAFQQNAACGPV